MRLRGLALGTALLGTGSAVLYRRIWPRTPDEPATARPARVPEDGEPLPDGTGLTIVLNPAAGSAGEGDLVETLRTGLPGAELVELAEPDGLEAALEAAAAGPARAIGIVGGDGSINTAAGIAHAAGKPLVVVPGGTLNHLARDLGLDSVDDAIAAVRGGTVIALDIAEIAGHPFLNTASFGGYPEVVDARERLTPRLGKWLAMTVAMVRVLHSSEPVEVEIDGEYRSLWMIFIGNCRYQPSGFAPAWRDRLDDGRLDVRLVPGHPWSRLRLISALLTGTLARCPVYETMVTDRLTVRSRQGPLRLARDGETFDGPEEFTVAKRPEPLAVYVPGPVG